MLLPSYVPNPARNRFVVFCVLCLCAVPFPSAHAQAKSDSERLEKLERAVELLQKRNAELEQEVQSLKKQKSPNTVSASAATPLATEKRSHFTPDSKSYVEKTEVKEEKRPVFVVPGASEIKLVLGGLLQTQYEAGDVSAFEGRFGSAAIDDRFRLRRMRISVTGDFAEQFDFKLEGEFAQSDTTLTVRDETNRLLASNSTRTSFGGLDLWANWHQFPEFQIKFGQYKAPFGFEQLSSDPKLLTAERSQVTSALTPERQIGVQFWGKPFASILPEQKDLVTYYAGIFNGNGRNVAVNDNDEYMFVGRLEVQPWKGKLSGADAWLKFGGNALSSRDAAGTVLSPAGSLRVNSDGSLSAFAALSAAERQGYGFDAAFHWGPFDLTGEYLSESYESRTVKGVMPTFSDFRAEGYYVQGGYFIVPKKLQVVTKYEHFNPGQIISDNLDSITGGLTYYVRGDDVKLMANY
ncbi:MAG TPA: porin, partial [Chthoniobacterales bacterium]|nr:porin [Chthoniobacterales bacterium]